MCNYAECQNILIALRIILRLYDSSNRSLANIGTNVFYNQSREKYCDLSLGKLNL